MTLNAVGYVVDVATDHLATLFAQRAKQHPDREFLVFGSRRMSYRQIERDAVALAGALAGLGVQTGDRLAVDLPNWPEWVVAFLAAAYRGAVLVPLDPSLTLHELKYQLRHAEVRAALVPEAYEGADFVELYDEVLPELPELRAIVLVGATDRWLDDRVYRYQDLVSKASPTAPMALDRVDAAGHRRGEPGLPRPGAPHPGVVRRPDRLRAHRDGAHGDDHPLRGLGGAAGGDGRSAHRRRGREGRRLEERRPARPRGGGRAGGEGTERHAGLLPDARRDGAVAHHRGILPDGRPRARGRGRLRQDHGPPQRAHHPWRLQDLSARAGGPPPHAPCRERRLRRRHPQRDARGADLRLRRAHGGLHRDGRRAQGLLPRRRRRLQSARPGALLRHVPADRKRKGEATGARAGRRPGTERNHMTQPPQAHLPRPVHHEPPAHAPNAALMIDFDNVTMGIRSDLQSELRRLLQSDIIKGKVAVQRAYADWRRYPQYIVPLAESSIDMIWAPAYGSNKKNATDIRLAVDALELVFTRPEIGTFILLSGDSDFSSLVLKLKEYGKYVIGVGIRESASDLLIQNCDEYYSYNELAGLTKESDVTHPRHDPWDLVIEAVKQMTAHSDVDRK